jgi:hypothetical protein
LTAHNAQRSPHSHANNINIININNSQHCFDGGDLVCCDGCPAVYHLACLGVKSAKQLGGGRGQRWRCPQHHCGSCGRNAVKAGGVIFRCISCAFSCCYDHKPATAVIVAANARHEALGYPSTQHTCYIHCKCLPSFGAPTTSLNLNPQATHSAIELSCSPTKFDFGSFSVHNNETTRCPSQ